MLFPGVGTQTGPGMSSGLASQRPAHRQPQTWPQRQGRVTGLPGTLASDTSSQLALCSHPQRTPGTGLGERLAEVALHPMRPWETWLGDQAHLGATPRQA